MLKIIKDKVPSLRSVSKEVTLPLSDRDQQLLDKMLEHLKNSQDPSFREKHPTVREGIGLAAPQVGVNKRMLVIHYPNYEKEGEYISYQLVNPQITVSSLKKCYLKAGEGCLSVDQEHPGYAYRAYRITVKAYDALKKEDVEIKAKGFDAIVLQHEIDHLNGILFYDHIDKNNPFRQENGAIEV